MTYNETEILIQKYLNGETTTEEERLLALEVSQEDAPVEWKMIAEMLGELTIDEALFDQIMAECRQKPLTMKLWPWVAAACVAAVVAVLLLPSRESRDDAMTGSGESANRTCSIVNEQGAEGAREFPTTNQDCRTTSPDTHNSRITKTIGREPELKAKKTLFLTQPSSPVAKVHPEEHSETTQKSEEMLAQEKPSAQPLEVITSDEKASADLAQTQPKPQKVVLTERDIPISRPENYRYTPEELVLMRRQANEAYVKWMELELEIMKYQFEQIAKQ